jgi:dihydrofolate reductase
MGKLRYSTSMSLDGFVAGPDQSPESPLGVGGHLLHEWMRALAVWRKEAGLDGGEVNASTAVVEAGDRNIGAIIMGRNMFGGGPGPWGDPPWQGWWGETPPFHRPVFVLTHHRRAPLELSDTTFVFVTEGIGVALELARDSAVGADVALAGGGGVARQYLAGGLVDELQIHLVPVLLGGGVRLFDEGSQRTVLLEQSRAVEAPGVVHLTYSRPSSEAGLR